MSNALRLLGIALISTSTLSAQDDDLTRMLVGADLLGETLTDRSRDTVRLQGNATLTEDELRTAIAGQIQELIAGGVTPPRADDAAYYLGAHYRKSGFAKADVTYRIDGSRLTLVIREGPRSLLNHVDFAGNTRYPDAQLAEYLIGAPLAQLAEKPEQFPYSAAGIEAGAGRIRDFYISEGHLDATVDASPAQLSAGGTRASVTLRIVEGRRYTFGAVRFLGAQELSSPEQMQAALGESLSGAYSAGKVAAAQRNLQSHFRGRGYFQAQVNVEADLSRHAGGAIPVTFRIAPGTIHRFGAVKVRNEGGRLDEDFLPKRFAHLEGDIYDPEALDETFREMLRTSLFNNLRISTTSRGGQFVDLDLLVEEAPAREVGFTIGYGSYEGATVGVRLGDRNLFGHGRPISFAADWSQRGLNGELLYVNPWLFDTRFSLRSRLYSVLREEEGYSKSALGLRFDLGRRLAPNLEAAAFAAVEKVSIRDATIDPLVLGLTEYLFTDVGLTLTYDRRDDPLAPTRGFIASAALDLGMLDGEPAFTRGVVRFSYYLPLPGKTLLALGARAGVISPIVDVIPIDVGFFNGGANSVRSFAERDLGPKDALGNPLGGEFHTVFNAEFLFPLWKALQGAVFVDAGNLTDFDEAGLGDMRYGIGAGLRYQLPVGPLRLDYGVNPSPRADEDRGAFHFSFGFAF